MDSIKSVAVFLLLILTLEFYAQEKYKPGYVVTNKNDTLSGFIDLRSDIDNGKFCVWRDSKDNVSKIFTPLDILEYGIEDYNYYIVKLVSLNGNNKKIFLEKLFIGCVKLYYFQNDIQELYYLEKDSVLYELSNVTDTIVDENGTQLIRESNQYRKVLRYLFKDSPEIANKITYTKYKQNSLIYLVKEYHKNICNKDDYLDYSKLKDKTIFIEPYIGINNTWLFKNQKRLGDLRPYLGANIRFISDDRSRLLDFLAGLGFSSYEFEWSYISDFNGELYHRNLKLNSFHLPLTLEYSFSTKKIIPFVYISYDNVLLINQTASYVSSSGFSNSENLNVFYNLGFASGLGAKYNLINGSYLFVKNELAISFPSSISRQLPYFENDYVIWMVSMGYGFGIND